MHIWIAFLRAPKATALKPHKQPAIFLIPIIRGARKGNTREAISYDIEYIRIHVDDFRRMWILCTPLAGNDHLVV